MRSCPSLVMIHRKQPRTFTLYLVGECVLWEGNVTGFHGGLTAGHTVRFMCMRSKIMLYFPDLSRAAHFPSCIHHSSQKRWGTYNLRRMKRGRYELGGETHLQRNLSLTSFDRGPRFLALLSYAFQEHLPYSLAQLSSLLSMT